MANTFTTLQLQLPCRLAEAAQWWDEVLRVMGEPGDVPAEMSVIEHTDGHARLTVHVAERTTDG